MRKNKQRIFGNLTFVKIIPTIATLSALFVGFTQVRFALVGQWEFAVISVVGAAFLDATDGRLARIFNACSRFGAELDSLSDFAVFGLCPALVMYLYSLSSLNQLGWLVSVLFVVCMCLRLARFNTHDIENVKTPLSGRFFTGVPAPAGAILAMFPIVLHNAFGYEFLKNQYFCATDMVISGLLCISKIPTPSIKQLHIKREQFKAFLLGTIVAIGVLFAYTWKAFCLLIVAYICSIFVCARRASKYCNQANDKKITTR
ncbi:MAG: phosphatidylcholine/phosphatidylserine synthase [Holosporales bacterium]|jgi:CDP-diacylglycerol--serine O-phosphatidyltransferase|nr:phosphatidylcholine/phosphatidylserine synthase [Holosporales bacterium]